MQTGDKTLKGKSKGQKCVAQDDDTEKSTFKGSK